MKANITINDQTNDSLKIYAKELKISKDKLIGSILDEWVARQGMHNERGAGRHARFNDLEIAQIRMDNLNGASIRSLAKQYGCSVGLIHKIVSDSLQEPPEPDA